MYGAVPGHTTAAENGAFLTMLPDEADTVPTNPAGDVPAEAETSITPELPQARVVGWPLTPAGRFVSETATCPESPPLHAMVTGN